jgi:Lon protease-like protein
VVSSREQDLAALRAACECLPIFPLPNAVLLPGALLPLHVFEPRYRELASDILAPGQPGIFAVAMLEPGHEATYHQRPPVRTIAGAGVILGHEKLPDGRYNLVVRGTARVRIHEELPPERAYRQVRATPIVSEADDTEEDQAGAGPLVPLVAGLRAMCDRIGGLKPEIREALHELAHEPRPPGALADAIAAALIVKESVRQAVLEQLDASERLRLVIDQAARLANLLGGGSGVVN